MANYLAIASVCEAMAKTLEAAYDPADLDNTPLQFAVYRTADFQTPMDTGVSIYLYRVTPNIGHRTPASRILENGLRRRPQLPLDLHILVTAWAKRASLEQAILGWTLRVLEDYAVLPAARLNAATPDVFAPTEVVEVVAGQLSIEEMMRLWDGLPSDYQPSVPYVARVLRIESLLPPVPYTTVTERHLNSGQL